MKLKTKLKTKRHEGLEMIILLLWLIGVMRLEIDELFTSLLFIPYIIYLLMTQEGQKKAWFKKVLMLEPFLLFMVMSYLWFERTPMSFYGITLTYGVWRAVLILLKGSLTIGGVVAYTNRTGINGITKGMYVLKIPHAFILIFMQTYRYIGLMKDKAMQMMRAYRLRSPRKVKGIDISAWGSFPGQLFMLSLKQAEATHHAMSLRGFEIDKAYISHERVNRMELFIKGLFIVYLIGAIIIF